jgi:dipeptidyl aminopeptidase/acylaminoacyl peptidase
MKILVSFLALLTSSFVFALDTGSALPLELAYTMKTLGYEDRPSISPDGKWVVYNVYTPPVKSPGSELEIEPRFLPGGTPSTYVGSRLFLASTETAQPKSICPEKGNCWRPSWSADSSRVAFYSDNDGSPKLWLYDTKTGNARKVTDAKVKAKLWLGDEAYWSADGKKVYVPIAPPEQQTSAPNSDTAKAKDTRIRTYFSGKEIKEKAKEQPGQNFMEFFLQENNATLSSVDVDTGGVKEIVSYQTEPRPSCLTLSPSGKWIAYLSVYRINNLTDAKAFYDLAVVPESGGPVRVIAKDLEVNDLDYYTFAYRWNPGKDQLVYYKNKKVWFYDLAQLNSEPKQVAADLGELAPFPIAFTNDGTNLLLGTKPIDRKDYTGLWPASLTLISMDGSFKQSVNLPEPLDFIQVITASTNRLWQPNKEQFTSIWQNPKTGEKLIIESEVGSGKSKVVQKEIGRLRFVESSASDDQIIGTYEDAATPGDVYLFAKDLTSRKRISNVEPRFENIRLGSIEFFETQLAQYDGKIVTAQTAVILPPGAKKGDKLPAIVFHYGGDSLAKKADRFLAGSPASVPISIFVSRGYAALLTYLIIAPEGTPGNPVQNMVDVLLPQIYRAAELGYVDINRIALLGQSYGGYSTAAMITKTNLFRAAVAISGMYDLPGLYSWMIKDITPHMNWSESGQGRMGSPPWSNIMRYMENSPYYQADKINTPLLMIHGGNDDTCPVQDAEKMFAALRRLEKTAQLAVYDGEGHTVNTWSLDKAIDATERILKFLETYL